MSNTRGKLYVAVVALVGASTIMTMAQNLVMNSLVFPPLAAVLLYGPTTCFCGLLFMVDESLCYAVLIPSILTLMFWLKKTW